MDDNSIKYWELPDCFHVIYYENACNLENTFRNYELIILDEAQRIRNIGMVLKILHDEFKWSSKKQSKLPHDFNKSYTVSSFKVIDPESFNSEIYQL